MQLVFWNTFKIVLLSYNR